MDCIFCGIINGAISTRKVYEDDFTLAFMDTAGDVDGHMLVVPKKHCESSAFYRPERCLRENDDPDKEKAGQGSSSRRQPGSISGDMFLCSDRPGR